MASGTLTEAFGVQSEITIGSTVEHTMVTICIFRQVGPASLSIHEKSHRWEYSLHTQW